jgi:hypothetical protein
MSIRALRRLAGLIWRPALTVLLLAAAGCQAINLPLPGGPSPQPPTQIPSPLPAATATPLQPAATIVIGDTPVASQPTGELPPAPPTLPPSGGPQLAFIKDGDVWLLDDPGGQPYPLTVAGDIVSFTWSTDGQRLATFNGRALCFFHSDGSVRTACLELGLDEAQAQVPRSLVWSPDQRWIVLWNPYNPWDEGAIGWLIVNLDTTNEMYRIEDPIDWGASLAPNNEPGGFTGQPLFLPDGRLIGTMTHRYLCSEGGCHYQLYQFNFETKSLAPYPNKPEEGWSEGIKLVLSDDGRLLTNFGVFFFGCDSYVTFADTFELATQKRTSYNLENQAMADLALSPDARTAVFARTAGCVNQEQPAWSQTCGLFPGFEVYAMQHWDLTAGKFRDLPAGVSPDWSPDGQWIAFNSCLRSNDAGAWEPAAEAPASIYLMDLADKVAFVSEGRMPAWRPR